MRTLADVPALVLALALLGGCPFEPGVLPGAGRDAGDSTGDGRSDAPIAGDDARLIDAPVDASPPQPVTMSFPVVLDTTMDPVNKTSSGFGTSVYLIVDGDPAGGSLFEMDVSAIAPGRLVTAAAFHVWTLNDTGAQVDIYQVNEAWNETATFNDRMTGVAWTTPNAGPPSRGTTILASFVPALTNTEYTIPLPLSLVQGWVDNPATNHGITIQSVNADGARLQSREATSNVRPFLRVTYVP